MIYDFTAERAAYNVLKSVFVDKAYSSIELDRALAGAADKYRGRITAIVYGVLEKSVVCDYIIETLANKRPKSNIEILLKMAISDLLFNQDPAYAVIDKYVQFAKERFSGAQGFVNAVLKKVSTVKLPEGNDAKSISVRFSCPVWVVKRLICDYGIQKTVSILSCNLQKGTHIRLNNRKTDKAKLAKKLNNSDKNNDIIPSKLGYYVTRNILTSLKFDEFTPQSLSSMKAVNIYAEGLMPGAEVLDVCAAPGGKSIYLEELVPSKIYACDVHPHRVELIKSYMLRMGSGITAMLNDGLVLKQEWKNKFDLVICDVPCSGSGLVKSSPDILLFKSDKDVEMLTKLQERILSVSAEYVKVGGMLAYSTCSMFVSENESIADKLGANRNFEILPPEENKAAKYTSFFPDTDGCDGFFIAKWKRVR